MSTVLIGCKLPHGIVVKGIQGQDIKLNGMNTSMVAGGYGLTNVDADEAAVFFATHSDFAPVANNAIFTHQTDKVSDIIAIGEELQGEKTGFEGLNPETPVPGLKPEDRQATSDAALPQKPPVQAPKSKADKAAAQQLAAAKGKK